MILYYLQKIVSFIILFQFYQLKIKSDNSENMNIINKIDKKKCIDLIVGVIGINVTFVVCGVLFEWMTKLPYINSQTGIQQNFRSATGLIAVERGIVWIITEIYNRYTIPKCQVVKMPTKNVAICGFIIFFSSITNTEAIYMVSFPLTIMVKSCNILSVILVGVLCSRVRDKQLKLGPKKIVIAVVVTAGIIMFRFFDPQADFSSATGRKTQIFGLVLLLLSLLSDGFLPDFQAEIKQKYKPGPTQMMLQVNKWGCIFCIVYAIIIGQFFYTVQFLWYHPLLTIHLVSMSVLTFVGQIFVYRMIKQFKQHMVPFVVTTRKIVTVGFSLFYFNHKSSFGQIIGIILVFFITAYEFITQMFKQENQQNIKFQQKIPSMSVHIQQMQQVQHLGIKEQNEIELNTRQQGQSQQRIVVRRQN